MFGQLCTADQSKLQEHLVCENHVAGKLLLNPTQLSSRLGLVLRGTVLLQDPDLGLSVQIQENGMFGFGIGIAGARDNWQALSNSDVCIAYVAAEKLRQLCQEHPALVYFFPALQANPHNDARSDAPNLLNTPLRALLKRAAITVHPTASIQAAAQLMQAQDISSVMLVEDGSLVGLVTDSDLRNRVLAQTLDPKHAITTIATRELLSLDVNCLAFEALLLMTRHNIHHLPVTDGGRLLGMISTSDLSEQQGNSPVYLSGAVARASSVADLAALSKRVPHLQQHLVGMNANAYSTTHIITAVTDAITKRLITLAHDHLGRPPVDYVWVAAGSQARNEQTTKSDQDNCLILADDFEAARHGEYFRAFSKFVCDGLAACGYIHCPGNMMAMNDTWRQPKARWLSYFNQWIDAPEPKALMLTCVFFDLRAIAGQSELLEDLRLSVLKRTRNNSLFLAFMVGNALKHRPPINVFGNISVSRDGEHPGTLNLKHEGIVPIVDLARVYALAAGLDAVNTHDRLVQASQTHEVSAQGARDLRDALEFLSKLRITHQARQTLSNVTPNNYLVLAERSNFERSQLKNAFAIVQTLQSVLSQRYT